MNSGTDSSLLKLKVFETAETFFEKQYPTDGETIIGRNEQCDLVLTSRRTSKRHCRLYFQDDRWYVEDLGSQNGTKVNGAKIQKEQLKDGDVLEIGDYRIEVEWKPVTISQAEADEDDDRTVVITNQEPDDRTIISPLASSMDTSGDSVLEKVKSLVLAHKIAAGILAGFFLFFLMIAIIMPSSEDNGAKTQNRPENPGTTRPGAVHDLETQGRIDTYLQSGRDQFETGNYSQALIRFQAVLEIDPQNQSARSFLVETRQKMADTEGKRRQAREEERQKMERVKEIAARARQAMAADDPLKAREIIAEAVFLAPGSPDIVKLNSDIETAIADQQTARQQEEQQQAEEKALLKQYFDMGQQHYDRENYREALVEWEKLLALNIESPETDHIRHAIIHLRKLLADDIQKDYAKAVRYYKAKDSTRALVALQKVTEVAPDYQDTRRMMTEVSDRVEAKARQLYQEGLVYEGLGQNQKAAEKWRRVLKVMPLEDNVYHQRALNKLQ